MRHVFLFFLFLVAVGAAANGERGEHLYLREQGGVVAFRALIAGMGALLMALSRKEAV